MSYSNKSKKLIDQKIKNKENNKQIVLMIKMNQIQLNKRNLMIKLINLERLNLKINQKQK